MINHKSFIDKRVGKRYRETVKLGYQCVALDKKYCEEVYWIKGLSFWGSAINGWNRKWNLDLFFDRVDYPRQWDLVFFSDTPTNEAWHTAIHNDEYSILEQNWGIGWGTGLGVDAIRIHKAPTNALWFMRPKPMNDIQPLQQGLQKDCSFWMTSNCYRLNNWNDARSLIQEVFNTLMVEYINKHPHDAFLFLKSKGYKIKYLEMTFTQAKRRMEKWDAIGIRIYNWPNKTKSHFICIKKIDWKYWDYDSARPNRAELPDIDKLYEMWVLTDLCFKIS